MTKDKKIYQAFIRVDDKHIVGNTEYDAEEVYRILLSDDRTTYDKNIMDKPMQFTPISIQLDSLQPLIAKAFEKGRYFKIEISPIADYSFEDIKE